MQHLQGVLPRQAMAGLGGPSCTRKRPREMSHFDDFLRETTSSNPGSEKGLTAEELYGLYLSWCSLTACPPEPGPALWAALLLKGIIPGKNTLAMTGPAAADYIVASAPSLPGD